MAATTKGYYLTLLVPLGGLVVAGIYPDSTNVSIIFLGRDI